MTRHCKGEKAGKAGFHIGSTCTFDKIRRANN